jgi:hypothetical protein
MRRSPTASDAKTLVYSVLATLLSLVTQEEVVRNVQKIHALYQPLGGETSLRGLPCKLVQVRLKAPWTVPHLFGKIDWKIIPSLLWDQLTNSGAKSPVWLQQLSPQATLLWYQTHLNSLYYRLRLMPAEAIQTVFTNTTLVLIMVLFR